MQSACNQAHIEPLDALCMRLSLRLERRRHRVQFDLLLRQLLPKRHVTGRGVAHDGAREHVGGARRGRRGGSGGAHGGACGLPSGRRRGQWRREALPDERNTTRHSVIDHQRSSAVISGHQRSAMAEGRDYAYQTVVIAEPLRATQGHSGPLRATHNPSEPIPPAVPSPPAISMQSACNQHAIRMQSHLPCHLLPQSACNQHAIRRQSHLPCHLLPQSACNPHAIRMQSHLPCHLLPQSACNQHAIRM